MSSALAFIAPPYYARLEESDQVQIRAVSPFVNTRLLISVPGDFNYYPTLIDFALNTDATVGNREAFFLVLDSDSKEVTRQPVTTTQPNVVGYNYVWNITTGSGYFDGNTNVAAPLPPILLPGGYRFGVQVNGLGAGDTGTMIANVIRMPTGPSTRGGDARPELLPPLLVT